MIKSIELSGFKSFVSDYIELNNLTILTGLNSSGKSSVIQSLRMLEKVALGEKEVLLEGHGNDAELKNSYVPNGYIITAHLEKNEVFYASSPTNYSGKNKKFPKVIYISADRFGPRVSIPMEQNTKLGSRGENLLHCIEENGGEEIPPILRHEKSQGDTFSFNLEAWLNIISPNVKFKKELQPKSDSSYSLFNDHRATNVGFGLSYALPVITALLVGSITKNSIVLLENPEAHLHPRGQTEIARLIALSVQAGVQVVVETHSDHLFDGIRVFAKQEKNKGFAAKVNTYWFELDKNNNTVVESAVIDDNGRVNNWPKGMFDQFEINASELL